MSGREVIEAAAELSRTTWKDRVARLHRLAPTLFMGAIAARATSGGQIDLAVRNVRVLARGVVDAVIEPAVAAARHASAVLEQTTNLSVSVIVGQVRSTAVDLLRTTGMEPEVARARIRDQRT